MSDEIITVRSSESFRDVANAYDHWPSVTDEGVLHSLAMWESRRRSGRILGT
jgi:predicted phosphoribosyltransferase